MREILNAKDGCFWREQIRSASERPRRHYEYYVTGHGDFPLDMLRHDCCWPATGDDASKIVECDDVHSWGRTRSIKMYSWTEPTVKRWCSFGWSVGIRNLEE